MRIGQSSDIHRLVEGRKLILGGVEIESDLGLLGHSDADALTHAVAEAILGALALGDLGKWFPDTDPEFVKARLLRAIPDFLDEDGLFHDAVIAQVAWIYWNKNLPENG